MYLFHMCKMNIDVHVGKYFAKMFNAGKRKIVKISTWPACITQHCVVIQNRKKWFNHFTTFHSYCISNHSSDDRNRRFVCTFQEKWVCSKLGIKL